MSFTAGSFSSLATSVAAMRSAIWTSPDLTLAWRTLPSVMTRYVTPSAFTWSAS